MILQVLIENFIQIIKMQIKKYLGKRKINIILKHQ